MNTNSDRHSFWTSMPGILTGIAAVIGSITAAIVVFQTQGNEKTVTPTPDVQNTPTPDVQNTPTPDVQNSWSLIGTWKVSGTSQGQSVSASVTFNPDSSYNTIGYVGALYVPDTGSYVFDSLRGTLTLNSYTYGRQYFYNVRNIQENSFHVSAIGLDLEYSRQ
jgi:hypothetical protein